VTDTMKMTHDEYQDHMDMLAKRVGMALEGQRLEDGISACAANIGFAMTQMPEAQHAKMREHIWRIVDAIIEKVPSRPMQ